MEAFIKQRFAESKEFMVETKKYISKPLIVDAVQVTKENINDVAAWCHGEVVENRTEKKHIQVRVVNPKTPRQTKAFVGDWVIYGTQGFKVFNPKAFPNIYEPHQEQLGLIPESSNAAAVTEQRIVGL